MEILLGQGGTRKMNIIYCISFFHHLPNLTSYDILNTWNIKYIQLFLNKLNHVKHETL